MYAILIKDYIYKSKKLYFFVSFHQLIIFFGNIFLKKRVEARLNDIFMILIECRCRNNNCYYFTFSIFFAFQFIYISPIYFFEKLFFEQHRLFKTEVEIEKYIDNGDFGWCTYVICIQINNILY